MAYKSALLLVKESTLGTYMTPLLYYSIFKEKLANLNSKTPKSHKI